MKRTLYKSQDKYDLAYDAAKLFTGLLDLSIQTKGHAYVALSGGSTPKLLYHALVEKYYDAVDWSKVDFFWSDERTVPIEHADSNMGMAIEHLLKPLDIDPSQLHLLETEQPPAIAAELYEKDIQNTVPLFKGIPLFDIILLGMGDDGHTASLFPQTRALHEKHKLVVANKVEKLNTWRLTFTFPLLNHANQIIFLVSGENKKQRVYEIFTQQNKMHPAAQVMSTYGQTIWLLDEDAAQLI